VAVSLGPFPKFQAFDNSGNPLDGGKLFTYASGTSTPLATYTDSTGGTANTNPVVLDTRGEASVWLTIGSAYRLVLKNSTEATTFWTIDGVVSTPNGNPTLIDDYEATVAQSNQTTDPGETGAENLATTQAGMWERVKFIIGEMKGVSWRTSNTTRKEMGTFNISSTDGTWTPTGTTIAFYRFKVPDGWVAGTDITLFYMRRAATGGGTTARMTALIHRVRDNTAIATIAAVDVDFTPADVQDHLSSLLVSGGSLAAADFINIQVTRLGDDGIDSLPAVAPDGHYFQYTGIASR
jgi:hypothetical protein